MTPDPITLAWRNYSKSKGGRLSQAEHEAFIEGWYAAMTAAREGKLTNPAPPPKGSF